MKKFLTFVLVLAMVLSVSSFAMAAETYLVSSVDDLDALFDGGTTPDVADGDTITLQSDLTIDTKTYTIPDGVSITLNMNGKKLTVTDSKTALNTTEGNYELFYIYGEMTVTGNGTIELTSTTNRYWKAMSAIFHNRGGVLTIENGTFKNLGGTDMAWVVDNSGNYYGDATTNIKDGTLTSTYTAIRNRMEQNEHGASGKAILNVSGGTITGTTSAIWAQAASTSLTAPATGEINVSGGSVGVINTARSNGAESMLNVSGGTVEKIKAEQGEVSITDGSVGAVEILDASGNSVDTAVVLADGTFGDVLVATVGDTLVVGAPAIQEAAEANPDKTVTVKQTSSDSNKNALTLPEGTKVVVESNIPTTTPGTTTGSAPSVTVNGTTVNAGEEYTVPVTQNTANPSSGYYFVGVRYNGGNSFSTDRSDVPVAVLIDGQPVSFSGNGSNFVVDCINPGASRITIVWNTIKVDARFTPDANAYCTQTVIPKTGGMSIWAAIAQFLGF